MISRVHRFHGYNSLRSVYSRGQTVRSPLLAVKYLRNGRRSSYRAAVVVSRKVHKSAVVRNRIRRRLYEVLRLYQSQLTEPYDIVITVFDDQLAGMTAGTLTSLLHGQLKKAGLLHRTVDSSSVNNPPHGIVDP